MSEFVIHPWEKKDEFKDLRMFPFEITTGTSLSFCSSGLMM